MLFSQIHRNFDFEINVNVLANLNARVAAQHAPRKTKTVVYFRKFLESLDLKLNMTSL